MWTNDGWFCEVLEPPASKAQETLTIETLVVLALFRNDAVNDLQHPRIHLRMKVLAKH
jgi:hypothetical protein